MATRDFLLPDLGEGLTEGEIVSWLVAVGDAIAVDQPVAEVLTAKATVEVPSPFAGTVVTLHGEVGGEVLVGKPLVTIDTGGDGAAPSGAAGEVASVRGGAPGEVASVREGAPGEVAAEAEVADDIPAVDDPVDDGGSGSVLVGYGTSGGGGRRRRRGNAAAAPPVALAAAPVPAPAAPAAPAATPVPVARDGRPLAKPPVRKMARDLGIDLQAVAGSGRDGVITREDVQRHAATPAEAAPPAAASAGPELSPASAPAAAAPASQADRIPLRGVRKLIAEQMTRSRREIPEATTWVDCDATGLWELRRRVNARQQDVKVSPLAIVLRAAAAALREYPTINASLDEAAQEIVLHRHVNLGFAAATDRGLVVPVIKGAERLSLLGIAAELNRLAAAARDGSITPDELRGGTFTASNYGSFGVDGGNAVINHPEAAILGVGQIADRPWVVDGEVVARKVMQLSIAFDHRISDGAEAGGFLRFLADAVEDPDVLLANL